MCLIELDKIAEVTTFETYFFIIYLWRFILI